MNIIQQILVFTDHHPGIVAIIVAAINGIILLLISLYFNGANYEFNKNKKIQTIEHKTQLNGVIYPKIMQVYLDYIENNRAYNTTIQLYTSWNKYTPTVCKVKYKNYNLNEHNNEIGLMNFLVKNKIIDFYDVYMYSNNNDLKCYEYILTPSKRSWDIVEKQYKQTIIYKKKIELGNDLITALHPNSRRKFLEWFIK